MRSIHLAPRAAAATLIAAALLAGCSSAVDQGPGTAASIAVAGGSDITGVVASEGGPFVFIVKDASGNPVPNVTVNFTIAGAGVIGIPSATTDNSGTVLTTVTYGHLVGTATITATAIGVTTPATLQTSSYADAASAMVPFNSGQSAPAGTQIVEPFSVLVTDQYGNPVGDVQVAWHSDAGVFGTPTARTGSDGKVQTTFTLPATPGAHAITATTSFGVANFSATGT